MPYTREHALDILGLPTFASESDIILRYKALSLMWFPETHFDRKLALQEFSNITEAAFILVFPERGIPQRLKLPAMYNFFQYVFFGNKEAEAGDCNCDSDYSEGTSAFDSVTEEMVACDNATELILEEEREKHKAEKRRAKKKKRKEKKKLEKLEKEKVTEQGTSNDSTAGPSKINGDPKSSEESEEDLDPNSAFVAVIAKKHKKHTDVEMKDDSRHTFSNLPKEDPTIVIFRSREIALRGNEMASAGYFSEAAELFTESIKLDPTDYRFYGNRSYCWERLGYPERSLRDAEKSITINPEWPKGYFRKGRALVGLKKYALAEPCFEKVTELDEDCVDAVPELRNCKILQVMEKGYSKINAEQAITKHQSVAKAISSLAAQNISRLHVKDDIFISDDESETAWDSVKKSKVADHLYDIKRDPNNPEGHSSLWIGNVQPEVTEKKLVSMFSKFGELISVKVMPEKFCAFINYKSKTSPGKAMQAYQAYELNGYKLVVRFPNLPGETVVLKKKPVEAQPKGAVNGNECYYWRTTGCIYAEQCRFKHIKAHKGIDKKKWMV